MFKRYGLLASLLALVMLLNGCAAVGTATKKQDLKLNAKLTQTVFLDPVAADQRSVFIQIRNSSESQLFDVTDKIAEQLTAKGYQVTDDPDQATYWLQANVRYVGPPEGQEFEDAMSGTGAVVQGAIAGAAISSATGGSGSDNAKAAVVMALIGYAADAMVEDVYHTSITDIQLSERVKGEVTTQSTHNLKQGESGADKQIVAETSDRKKYQTRVLVTANQMNMDLVAGETAMQDKLVTVVSGLF